ncbi:unnamed protein product, partial [Rotaria socialis]
LDGRFNKLRTLHVNIDWIAHSTLIIDDMVDYFNKYVITSNEIISVVFTFRRIYLPNLECFSRHYLVSTSDYDELIVRILHRILNLVTLSLYITVYFKSTFIDGNDLKKNVSNVISCLESGTAKLFPLAMIQQKSNPYVCDDTIFIKIMVPVGDMSKAPIHIQQLLIKKEVMLSQQPIETDFDKDHFNGQQSST